MGGAALDPAIWLYLPSFGFFLAKINVGGVKLVISDSHEGLKKAAAKVLSATWQRCRVHFIRNALAHVGAKQRAMVAPPLRRRRRRRHARSPTLGTLMSKAEDDVLAHLAFPKEHWPQLRSTNPLERSRPTS